MRSLSAPLLAALAGSSVPLVQLFYFGFASPIALNSSNFDLVYASITFKGAAQLGSVTTIQDSPGEIKGLNFELSGLDAAYIALALDDAGVVQGTLVHIRTAILDSSYQIIDAPLEWAGTLDTMSIVE